MTVKEMIKKLSKYPENMDVFVAERKTDFNYGLVNSCYKNEINFMEHPDGEILSSYEVVILDEE